jgi:nucleoside-diphosphate-sugar epimerase
MPHLLIAGCGWLGQSLALMAQERGWQVLGLCRSQERVQALRAAGIAAQEADFSDAGALAAVAQQWPRSTAVVHCAAAGRGGGAEAYRAVYLHGMRRLLTVFPDAARMVFTSSTSVYAQVDGSVVTEDSPAEPDRDTGRILRHAEEETLRAGGTVLRLAGLYGPGRSVLLKNFLTGEARIEVRRHPPATPDGRWVNQIHREDAARALLHVLTAADAGGRLFNAADSTPMLQRAIYSELCRRYPRPLPPEGDPDTARRRGWTHKRVDNGRLRALGWLPHFPSWFHALDHDAALVPTILAQLP